MIKYYSKIDPSKLLHMVVKKEEITPGRQDIVPEENFIQCSILNMEEGKTFKPHKHNVNLRHDENYIPQESWCVIKGKVQCIFYDIDDTIISQPILSEGDISFTFSGGHNYLILTDDTIVYEYKTGPYFGQEIDKTFIK